MKVNKIQWPRLKRAFEIKQMAAAYIYAEKQIMQNPGLTGFDQAINIEQGSEGEIIFTSQLMTPEEFNDRAARAQNMTIKDVQAMELKAKLHNMEKKGRELIDAEKYEELAELQEWYENTKKQYEKLSGKRYES